MLSEHPTLERVRSSWRSRFIACLHALVRWRRIAAQNRTIIAGLLSTNAKNFRCIFCNFVQPFRRSIPRRIGDTHTPPSPEAFQRAHTRTCRDGTFQPAGTAYSYRRHLPAGCHMAAPPACPATPPLAPFRPRPYSLDAVAAAAGTAATSPMPLTTCWKTARHLARISSSVASWMGWATWTRMICSRPRRSACRAAASSKRSESSETAGIPRVSSPKISRV